MSTAPMISVVVPFYNAQDTIVYCLESILAQSYTDFELILVNDGSTDSTEEILQRYANQDSRIRVITQENGGQASARNYGVSQACGKYTAFIDGDDFIHPDYLQAFVDVLDKTQGSALVVQSSFDLVSYETAYLGEHRWEKTSGDAQQYSTDEALTELMYDRITESPWGKIAPTSLWKMHLFPEGRLYEDLAVASSLFSDASEIYCVDVSLYAYVMREGSTTHVIDEEKIVKQYKDYRHALCDFCAGIPQRKDFRFPLAFRRCLSYARMYALLDRLPIENEWARVEKKNIRKALRMYLPLAMRGSSASKVQLARFALLSHAPHVYNGVFEKAKNRLSHAPLQQNSSAIPTSSTQSVVSKQPSDPLSKEEIQAYLLQLLLAFDAYCKSHGLYYSLAGGTMLGAIRHKGFIPWDDDIDVSMPRPDYEYLISHAEEFEKETGFILAGYRNLSLDISPIIKMENPTISILEIGTLAGNLYIDILPVDGLPASDDAIGKCYKRVTRLRDTMSLLLTPRVATSGRVVGLAKDYAIVPFNSAFPQVAVRLAKKLRDMSMRDNYDTSTKVGILSWGLYGKGEAIPKEAYENSTEVSFEGHSVQALRGWHEYLRGIYGDYMKLPPEDKRETHGIIAWKVSSTDDRTSG